MRVRSGSRPAGLLTLAVPERLRALPRAALAYPSAPKSTRSCSETAEGQRRRASSESAGSDPRRRGARTAEAARAVQRLGAPGEQLSLGRRSASRARCEPEGGVCPEKPRPPERPRPAYRMPPPPAPQQSPPTHPPLQPLRPATNASGFLPKARRIPGALQRFRATENPGSPGAGLSSRCLGVTQEKLGSVHFRHWEPTPLQAPPWVRGMRTPWIPTLSEFQPGQPAGFNARWAAQDLPTALKTAPQTLEHPLPGQLFRIQIFEATQSIQNFHQPAAEEASGRSRRSSDTCTYARVGFCALKMSHLSLRRQEPAFGAEPEDGAGGIGGGGRGRLTLSMGSVSQREKRMFTTYAICTCERSESRLVC